MATAPSLQTPASDLTAENQHSPGGKQQSLPQSRIFLVYNGFRLLLGVALLSLLVFPVTAELVRQIDRGLFVLGALALLGTSLPLAGRMGIAVQRSQTRTFGLLLIDITATALIVSASGGILSGFSGLYLITVAAAAVLLQERILATLIAALAVLAVLADTTWMVSRGEATLGMLLSAGLLGSLLFALSLLVQLMASRITEAEAEATEAQAAVDALQRLNAQIIGHMETGILLAEATGEAKAINSAAERLIGLAGGQQTHLLAVSAELANQFQEWRETGSLKTEPFRLAEDGPTMVASFVALGGETELDYLIFIEDYTPVTQFAQSLKLNSLSKLTASIAHEIRNPLGAISHAAQLLTESSTVDEADRILCDILVSNSRRVSDIIDNVSEVSRRQAPRAQYLALNVWLPVYLDEYRALRTQDCDLVLRLSTEPDAEVAIDPEHFKRILSNLLDNGLRHSEEEGNCSRVRIDVLPDPNGQSVFIDIVDFGLGVAEHNLTRLFEPFFTTSKQGSGLGLYLCKELCEINGARVSYQRTRLGESAFRLTLDRERSPT